MMVSSRIEPSDPVFKNFKILLEICRTVFSPSVSDFEFILQYHDFLSAFKKCYPTERITYKMHCLVHYVRYIGQLVPLDQVWCMRYKGKHAYFKSLQKKIGNFTNPARTLSYLHQKSKCKRMISCNGKMLSLQVKFPGKNERSKHLGFFRMWTKGFEFVSHQNVPGSVRSAHDDLQLGSNRIYNFQSGASCRIMSTA